MNLGKTDIKKTVESMFEVGAHFGYIKARRHPSTKPFIFGAKDGVELAKEYGISTGIAGLIIAIVAVAPEIATTIKAAKNDEIQRVVNIAMGASTVSILLTVPILMLLAYNTGIALTLDFNPLEVGALILTIILVWKTTDEGHTNYFEGISHLMFFLAYAIIAAFF